MKAKTEIPKFRGFTYRDGKEETFYLSKGPVLEGGKPAVDVTWWDGEDVLRGIEKKYRGQEFSIGKPTLYESFRAAELDREVHDTIFASPAEWQRHLILNPNAPAETDAYVIMDTDKNVIGKSGKARNIIPVRTYKDGKRHIVEADVFDIPFRLKDGGFSPEDLSPETGFLTKQPSKGEYTIWFGGGERLYAAILDWGGDVNCDWEPGDSGERPGAPRTLQWKPAPRIAGERGRCPESEDGYDGG
jgi:hypothetical protein